MSSGASERAQSRRNAQAEAAAEMFKRGLSYRGIAKQMGITVGQAEAKVKAALGEDPKLFRRKKP